jgi:predicted RNase H-like HicB family nuclease
LRRQRVVREGSVFEFRLRILDVRERDTDPPSFLGIVEGFPEVLAHATTVDRAERDLVKALEDHLKGLMDHEATRLELDDFPTVRAVRLSVARPSM